MRAGMTRGLALAGVLSLLSGCVFTQWTDHAFFGSPDDPPNHEGRQWVGAVVLPLAVVGDLVTAPFQVIALMIMGDGGPYQAPNGRVAVVLEIPASPLPTDRAVALLQQQPLPGRGAGLSVWGLDASQVLHEIPLSAAQSAELAGRLQALPVLRPGA